MNNTLKSMLEEAVVTYFKVPVQYFLGETEKEQEKLGHYSRCPGRDLNPGRPEYDAGCQSGTDRGDVKLIQIAQIVSMKGFHHNGDELTGTLRNNRLLPSQ
jgi:hypothetical protein